MMLHMNSIRIIKRAALEEIAKDLNVMGKWYANLFVGIIQNNNITTP